MDIDDIGIYCRIYWIMCWMMLGKRFLRGFLLFIAFHAEESVLYLENPMNILFQVHLLLKHAETMPLLLLATAPAATAPAADAPADAPAACGCNNSPYSSFYCYQTFALCCQCWHTVMDEMTWFNHLIAHPTKRKCFRRNAAFWQCIFVQHLPALSIRWRSCYKL